MAIALSEKDQQDMDRFLIAVFEDVQSGRLTQGQFVSGMAHVLTAAAISNESEVKSWLQQGRKFMREEV